MQLLAATAGGATASGVAFTDRIPLLLPYFRHTLASVRRSCLGCMDALLQSGATGESLCGHRLKYIHISLSFSKLHRALFGTVQFCLTSHTNCGSYVINKPVCFAGAAATWPRDLLPSLLRLAFQNLLQEEDDKVRAATQQFWQRLLQQLASTVLAEAIPAHVIQVQSHATVAKWCTFCVCEPNTHQQADVLLLVDPNVTCTSPALL